MDEPAQALEIEAPDIGPYAAGNTGINHVVTLDSGRDGPHVMLSAVVHGNELCGATTLDYLLRRDVRPVRGRLTLAFANVAAYGRFDPSVPSLSRFVDEDFNRLWSAEVLDGPRDSVELRRARRLRPLLDEVDFLLDIHSMHGCDVPLVLCGPLDKGRALACAVGVPALVVSDRGHAAGTRMRDYGRFADPASPRNALLVECGQHWRAETVRVAREVALRFLDHLGLVDPAFVRAQLPGAGAVAQPQRLVEITNVVTIHTDAFRFTRPVAGLEIVPRAGTLLATDGDLEVRTPYDDCLLVMPSRRQRPGDTAVRLGRFVE